MKKDNVNYFMAGLFTLLGLALLMFMLVSITSGGSLADEYIVEFDNVSGINDGTIVTFNGYEIGSVTRLLPVVIGDQTRYRLVVNIKSGWRIPVDSRAQIVMPAVIADKQIEITQGKSIEYLNPGNTINSAESKDMMQLVNSMAQQLHDFVPQSTEQVRQLLQKLNSSADQFAMVFSEKNVSHLNNVFQHADKTSGNLSELVTSFNRINLQLNTILDKTDMLIDDNSDDVRYTITEMKKSIDVVSARIESVMYHLDSTSQNMNEFSRQLRNNPGALLNTNPPAAKHSGD